MKKIKTNEMVDVIKEMSDCTDRYWLKMANLGRFLQLDDIKHLERIFFVKGKHYATLKAEYVEEYDMAQLHLITDDAALEMTYRYAIVSSGNRMLGAMEMLNFLDPAGMAA